MSMIAPGTMVLTTDGERLVIERALAGGAYIATRPRSGERVRVAQAEIDVVGSTPRPGVRTRGNAVAWRYPRRRR